MANAPSSRFWIGVAVRKHVQIGVRGGFCQLGHGKVGPLKRLKAGDGLVYYSPKETLAGDEKVRAFVAIGRVREGEPYEFDLGGGFTAWRRPMDWFPCKEMSIRPLIGRLSFIRDKAHWGAPFRFGLVPIGEDDFRLIAQTMGVRETQLAA
jgi:hypothetical protein